MVHGLVHRGEIHKYLMMYLNVYHVMLLRHLAYYESITIVHHCVKRIHKEPLKSLVEFR